MGDRIDVTTKKQGPNRKSLDALLGVQHKVTVNGSDLHLKRPSRAQLVALREQVLANQDKLTDDKDMNLAVQQVESIVAMCVPDLRESEAFELIMVAGGERSELVARCFELCGMNQEEAAELTELDPTPSS